MVETMRLRALQNQSRSADKKGRGAHSLQRREDSCQGGDAQGHQQGTLSVQRVEETRPLQQMNKSSTVKMVEFQDDLKVKVEVKVEVEEQSHREESRGHEAGATTTSALCRWSELLLESARARIGKREAVRREDFAEASRLKRRETELGTHIEAARKEASVEGDAGEKRRLEEAKRRAVAAEDFVEASRLKKRLRAMDDATALARGGSAASGPGAAEAAAALEAWRGALLLARGAADGPALLVELRTAAPPGVATEGEAPALASATAPAVVAHVIAASANRAAHKATLAAELATAVQAGTAAAGSGACAHAAVGSLGAEGGRAEVRSASSEAVPQRRQEADPGCLQTPPGKTAFLKAKEEEAPEVKEEALECSVPGRSTEQVLSMSNQDLWQHAWNVTWQKADAIGQAGDQAQVYAQAQKVWKVWLAERDQLLKQQAAAEGQQKAEEICKQAQLQEVRPVAVKAENAAEEQTIAKEVTGSTDGTSQGSLSSKQLAAQEAEWRESKGAQADWQKVTGEVEKRRKAKEEAPRTSRDLCALVKQRCPADQPLQFERLLAVCPKGTTVRQLVQAMSKEPQEFRQSWDGGEYCVRPVNSRCVDWLPVQATTTPPGFREDASLPEEMLVAARAIFEERLKPLGQAAEDPLAQFLVAPGRLPPDTPLPFDEILKRCPPGTQPSDLVRTMSKRRDSFRQDPSGKLFCVKPRARCSSWAAVNPYLNPLKPSPSAAPMQAASRAPEPAGDGGDY